VGLVSGCGADATAQPLHPPRVASAQRLEISSRHNLIDTISHEKAETTHRNVGTISSKAAAHYLTRVIELTIYV